MNTTQYKVQGDLFESTNSGEQAGLSLSKPLDHQELLLLLDYVNSVMVWCSVNMPNGSRFQKGNAALWAVAHRLSGKHDIADRLIEQNHLLQPESLANIV